jgi:hypothetical protein
MPKKRFSPEERATLKELRRDVRTLIELLQTKLVAMQR